CESAGGSHRDPSTSWTGASPDSTGEHGPRTGQELRRALAGMQCASHESGESGRLEPGTANGARAIAGGTGVAERADWRVQRTHREVSPGKLSASGTAEADQGRGHTDRAYVFTDAGRCASFSQKPRRGLLPGTAAGTKELRPE